MLGTICVSGDPVIILDAKKCIGPNPVLRVLLVIIGCDPNSYSRMICNVVSLINLKPDSILISKLLRLYLTVHMVG